MRMTEAATGAKARNCDFVDGSPRSIVIIAKAFPPCSASGSARPDRFAKYLPNFGYRVSVVAEGYSTDVRAHVYPAPGPAPSRAANYASKLADAFQRWVAPYNDSYPWLPFAIAEASRALRDTDAGLVLSTSPPVANHLAALALKLRHGVRWIADFRDPLWGNPFRIRRGAHMYDRAIEKAIFRFADAVIANTDTLAEMWRDRHPIWAEKISVLWNGYDPQDSIEAAPLPARTARVLAHVGNIYQGRTPEPVLASIERLIRSGRVDAARLRIQLIGFLDPNSIAQDRPPFKTLADCKCLEFTGESLPQGQAREFMRGADYLLLIDVNGVAEGLQVPAKIFDYIRVGRPILALTSSGSPVERILARSGIAYACITPCMRPERVDETVLHFLNRSSAPACPTSYFLETFDAERQTRALARRLDKLFAQTDSFRIASPRPRREDL